MSAYEWVTDLFIALKQENTMLFIFHVAADNYVFATQIVQTNTAISAERLWKRKTVSLYFIQSTSRFLHLQNKNCVSLFAPSVLKIIMLHIKNTISCGWALLHCALMLIHSVIYSISLTGGNNLVETIHLVSPCFWAIIHRNEWLQATGLPPWKYTFASNHRLSYNSQWVAVGLIPGLQLQ